MQNYLLFMAIVLDPHFKLAYMKYYFDEVYKNEKVKEMGNKVDQL